MSERKAERPVYRVERGAPDPAMTHVVMIGNADVCACRTADMARRVRDMLGRESWLLEPDAVTAPVAPQKAKRAREMR